MQIIRVDSFSPRVESSTVKSGVSLPPDLFKLIDEVFNKGFLSKAPEYSFHTSGKVYPEELNLNISLKKASTITQLNFCASLDFDKTKEEQMDLINVAVDALGSFVEQYLEAEGDIEIPKDWNEFEFETRKVYLKFNTNNSDLESAADALLGIDPLSTAENELDSSLAGLELQPGDQLTEDGEIIPSQLGEGLLDRAPADLELEDAYERDLNLISDRQKWKNNLN